MPFALPLRAAVQGLAVWALLLPLAASAQPEAPLTLADTVSLARDNSLKAQVSRKQLRGAELAREAINSRMAPSLSFDSSANYGKLPGDLGKVFAAFGAGITGFPADGVYVDSALQGTQPIFDAFASRDALAINDLETSMARLAVSQAEQDAMSRAAMAYFQVLRAEGLADVASNAVKQAQDHLRLAAVRLKAGAGTRAESLQLRAQLANAEGQFTKARNEVSLARLALSNAVNAPVGDRPLDAAPAVPALTVSAERDLAQALSRRPELQQLELQRHVDETRVQLESRALWPTVAASGRYSQRNLYDGIFTGGLNVKWDLFDGFRTRNKIESARNEAESDQVRMEEARQAAALEVREQLQNREEARSRIGSAREGLAASQEAYHIAVRRFEVGLASPIEVSDIQSTLIQASDNFVQAVNDLRVAELRLARAMGVDLAGYVAPEGARKAPGGPAAPKG